MENKKIFGNLVGVPTPKTDWNQTDEAKADYVVGSKEYRAEVNNNFSNALRGSASGNSGVVLHNVSPIEHIVSVKLTSNTITDFSDMVVTKQGKNLIDYKNDFETVVMGSNNRYAIDLQQHISADNVVTLSYGVKDMNVIPEIFYFYSDDPDITEKNNGSTSIYLTSSTDILLQKITFKIRDGYIYRLYYRTNNPTDSAFQTWLDKFKYIQVELSTNATPYEPYVEPITYVANADGTVDNVTSLHPTTMLLVDNSDVIVNAEACADITAIIGRIFNAIISLGGNI